LQFSPQAASPEIFGYTLVQCKNPELFPSTSDAKRHKDIMEMMEF